MKNTKHILFTAVALAIALHVNAVVRTVSNWPSGGAQYSSFDAAYNAAANDDTLMFEGTGLNYTLSQTFNKRLVIIGIGFNPNKQNPLLTQIDRATGDGSAYIALGASANGSKFYGISFTGTSAGNSFVLFSSFNNITFENCRFVARFSFNNQTGSNIIFKNCIFDGDNSENIALGSSAVTSNILFTNCIFDGYINGNSNNFITAQIDHCLFLSTSQVPLQNVRYFNISNSIFMNNATVQSGTSANNVFNNNVNRLGSMPSGSNNLNNTNPNFVTYTLGSLYSTGHNYNLQSGSPAIGAASDATDIGVNGGFTNFNESGEVLINPIMRAVNIQNTTVQPNGTLNVQIQATKPNDQ